MKTQNVVERVLEAARRVPDRPAFVFRSGHADATLTYASLWDRIDWTRAIGDNNTAANTNVNTEVAATAIQAYLCPSDGANDKGRMSSRANVAGTYGVTNPKAVAYIRTELLKSWRNGIEAGRKRTRTDDRSRQRDGK